MLAVETSEIHLVLACITLFVMLSTDKTPAELQSLTCDFYWI